MEHGRWQEAATAVVAPPLAHRRVRGTRKARQAPPRSSKEPLLSAKEAKPNPTAPTTNECPTNIGWSLDLEISPSVFVFILFFILGVVACFYPKLTGVLIS